MLNQAHTRFHPNDSYNRKLAPEVTDVEPGMAMLVRLVDGADRVFPSTGTADEGNFAGVSWTEKYCPTTHIRVRSFPITADGYELPDAVVGGNDGFNVRIAGAAATEDNAAPTAAGHVFLDGKVLRFFTGTGGDTGKMAIVTYRHVLSVVEAMQLYGNGPYGQSTTAVTGTTGIVFRGLMFTNMFDLAADWAAPVITDVRAGAGGTFTRGGTGVKVPATVIHAPSEDNPFLGLRVNV